MKSPLKSKNTASLKGERLAEHDRSEVIPTSCGKVFQASAPFAHRFRGRRREAAAQVPRESASLDIALSFSL